MEDPTFQSEVLSTRLYTLFEELIKVGFTRAEALELILAMMPSMMAE